MPGTKAIKYGVLLLLTLCSLITTTHAFAKTAYIHDVLRVDLRAGPTNGYKIINFLRSGSELKVLDESSDGKWVKVQYRSQTGWIQSQYLTDQPVAADLLVDANAKLQSTLQENQSLKSKLLATETELRDLKAMRSKLDTSNSTLQKELENLQRVSKNAINTERSYRQLQENTELLKVELENLKAENAILSEDNLKEGIKWGIIAVFVGALLAVMIPKMSGRKRRNEW
ncbi:MAG: TIGR04211 family SH3 domain-containing protein [Pseudomonadales bacterium]|nr:TIGR04211 family SH3 domain-containing protein [Pseudomonadales bacterium]